MIFITGDTHGDVSRLSLENFPEQKEMTKDDYVIILGDFGLIWDYKGENAHEKESLDWLESLPFTTLFIDGNHENFDRLNAYPTENWKGGVIHRIRPSVIHLMRGYVFNLQGKKCFAFGGAKSHDVQGGILVPSDEDFKKQLEKAEKGTQPFRIYSQSWWNEELPSEVEIERGMRSLEKADLSVDFVFTHCCSSSTQAILSGGSYKVDCCTHAFEGYKQRIKFKKWFFGHYHDNKEVVKDEILIYEQIVRIV